MTRACLSAISFALLLTVFSCTKDEDRTDYCQELQSGITDGDVDQVRNVITKFINGLPSQEYTEENINYLVDLIERNCGGSAEIECFDCIKTLPTQTEIRIGYPGTSGPILKAIDITYTSNYKMKFSNMHD